MGWRGLTRHTLVPGGSVAAGFEQRYFEIEPGGYSSLEKHGHAHVVVTLRGEGRVLVGDRVVALGHLEVLEIPPSTRIAGSTPARSRGGSCAPSTPSATARSRSTTPSGRP